MDDSTGACNFTTQSYSGSNAPFDEEVSLDSLHHTVIKLTFPSYLCIFAVPSSSNNSLITPHHRLHPRSSVATIYTNTDMPFTLDMPLQRHCLRRTLLPSETLSTTHTLMPRPCPVRHQIRRRIHIMASPTSLNVDSTELATLLSSMLPISPRVSKHAQVMPHV
jgi:hypothetical protein